MVISSAFTAALQITEIELNPPGEDNGNEWIELYSPDRVNLDGYLLINGKGKLFNLSGSLEGYQRIVVPTGNWLVNNNASILLLHGSSILQRALFLSDSSNDERTWNLCENEWVFSEGSPEAQNNCESSGTSTSSTNTSATPGPPRPVLTQRTTSSKNNTSSENVYLSESAINTAQRNVTRTKIVLGSPPSSIKAPSETLVTREGFVRNNLIYVFTAVCLGIIIFLLLRKK